jgi:short-subunit dehydrogenase
MTPTALAPGSPRRILITGASAGLGAALAVALARPGQRLALVARRPDRLEATADAVRARGGAAVCLPADLADPAAPERIVADAIAQLGGLDVLVNNAGIGLPDYFGRSEPADLGRQLAINLTAPILLARHALPHLARSRGLVINVGSAVTRVANPIFGVYGTTKAALAYWSDALRRELRHLGVRVCLVELGPVATDFFDAVRGLPGGARGLGIDPPPDALYNPVRDRPPAFLTITADAAARRIARLLERPRRRLALPRRAVWPMHVFAQVFRLFPALGDLAVSSMIRRVERESASVADRSGSPGRADLGMARGR